MFANSVSVLVETTYPAWWRKCWGRAKEIRRRTADFLFFAGRKVSAFGVDAGLVAWINASGKSWCLFRLAAIDIYCKPRG
jgi:hypothetical protein